MAFASPALTRATIRPFGLLTLIAACLACCTGTARAAESHEPAVAPPATPKVAAACEQAATEAKATADDVIPISGVGRLSGCVADTSGIDRILLGWSTADGRHGRICTDPDVTAGIWTCAWNTARLPEGRYDVRLVAIDLAGNEGTFKRAYEVHAPAVEPTSPQPSTPTPPGAPAPGRTPPTATPTEPATPVAPASPTQPTPPATTVDPATPVDPSAPVDPQPIAPVTPAPSPDSTQPAPAFSPIQQLVLSQVVRCERGGDERTPTDSDTIVTQLDQADAVRACLEPAMATAGAAATRIDDSIPVPPTILVSVATRQLLDELTAVLPDEVGGVPVHVELATPLQLAELTELLAAEAASADAASADAG